MKHYLVKIQNGTTCACLAYDSKDAAMAAYHTELAYRSSDRASTLCVVINESGGIIASEKYVAPPTPTPEPEPDGGESE